MIFFLIRKTPTIITQTRVFSSLLMTVTNTDMDLAPRPWQPEKVRAGGDSADSANALTVNVFCNAFMF